MRSSLICPIYDEKDSVRDLIESMLNQSKKPYEIIFVDSFSTDGTAEIIKKYSKKGVRLIQEKSNIARARNIAIKNAKTNIIACTDASSRLDKNWLENITKPFVDKSIDVVSGGFIAVSEGGIEDYIAMLTVKPMEEWKESSFLPSGRSIAFRKKAWRAVGGYPENLYTGEDTLFDLNLKKKGFKFKFARDAIVYWKGRDTLKKFVKQFYLYGKGDGEAGNLWKIPRNKISFLGINFYLLIFIGFLPFYYWISVALIGVVFLFLGIQGLIYAIKKKRFGALFYVPLLVFFKRFSYFIGVWTGLVS
jgi:glycosyltransferase involved in cell wall biosynthesis